MTPRDAHLRPIRHVLREFERFTRPYPRSPGDPAPVGRPGTGWATRHRLGGDVRLGDPAPVGRPGTDWAAISRHPIRMGRLTLRNAPRPRVGRVSTLRRGPGDRLARYSVRGAGTDGVSTGHQERGITGTTRRPPRRCVPPRSERRRPPPMCRPLRDVVGLRRLARDGRGERSAGGAEGPTRRSPCQPASTPPPAAPPPPRRRAPGSRPATDPGLSGRPSCC